MQKPSKTIPAAALLKLAREFYAGRRERHGALTVGIGFKHSRRASRNDGFGAVAQPCLTVAVERKLPPRCLAKSRKISKTATTVYRGKRYRVPTDVTAVGEPVWHQVSCAAGQEVAGDGTSFLAGSGTEYGSTGFVLCTEERDIVLLVTAGHVFNDRWANPNGGTIDGLLGLSQQEVGGRFYWVPRVNFGPVWLHFHVLDGLSYDIGAVRMGHPDGLALLARPPWSLMRRMVSQAELIAGFTQAQLQAVQCVSHGLMNTAQVTLQSVWTNPVNFKTLGTYAPIILQTLAKPGSQYAKGDSGAPLLDDQGALFGIHVVGDSKNPQVGYALAADSIRRFITGLPNSGLQGRRLVLFPFDAAATGA